MNIIRRLIYIRVFENLVVEIDIGMLCRKEEMVYIDSRGRFGGWVKSIVKG